MELPPICSASLESVTGRYKLTGHILPPPPVMMTFLSGCPRLQDVRVQFPNTPKEGTSVKIRCHCNTPWCMVPFEGRAEGLSDEPLWNVGDGLEEVGVRCVPRPISPQGVQAYTVLYTCHAPGPEQALKWGHVVMPGVL